MRTHLWVALTALWVGGLAGGGARAETSAGPGQTPSPPPPLVVEEEAPLLLEESPTNGANGAALQSEQDTSINAPCYVCHVNFKQDPFVQWHLKASIGCVKCHGKSPEHIADEANLTPPDVMYWPSRVGLSCYWCHPRHDVPAREVVARFQELGLETAPKKVLCTQCHGSHRLNVRTIVWDKRTRALISKPGSMSVRRPARPSSDGITNAAAAGPLRPIAKDELRQNLNP